MRHSASMSQIKPTIQCSNATYCIECSHTCCLVARTFEGPLKTLEASQRFMEFPLQWCHKGRDGVSNHQPHDCLLNRLFRQRIHQSSASLATELPAQMASNAENVSIWWRHHIIHWWVFFFPSCVQLRSRRRQHGPSSWAGEGVVMGLRGWGHHECHSGYHCHRPHHEYAGGILTLTVKAF